MRPCLRNASGFNPESVTSSATSNTGNIIRTPYPRVQLQPAVYPGVRGRNIYGNLYLPGNYLFSGEHGYQYSANPLCVANASIQWHKN